MKKSNEVLDDDVMNYGLMGLCLAGVCLCLCFVSSVVDCTVSVALYPVCRRLYR